MNIFAFKGISLMFAVLLGIGCYSYQEGCQDLSATNYKLDADYTCEDCCTYPSINFTLSHRLGAQNYHRDSILLDASSTPFKLEHIYFFIHEFQFNFSDQSVSKVDETIAFLTPDNKQIKATDDYQFVTPSLSSIRIPNIKKSGVIEQCQFEIGVPHNYIPSNASSALRKNDSLYMADTGYVQMGFSIAYGDSFKIKKNIEIVGTDNTYSPLFDVNIEKPIRKDVTLNMVLDYQLLFADILIQDITKIQPSKSLFSNDKWLYFSN